VLKHRNAAKGIDQELFVITFTLIPEDELETEKEKWESSKVEAKEEENSQKVMENKKTDENEQQEGFQDDDVD